MRGAVAAGVIDQAVTRDVDGRIGRATRDVDATRADGARRSADALALASPAVASAGPGTTGCRGGRRAFRVPWARSFSGVAANERANEPLEVFRRNAAPLLLGESVRAAKRTPCGSADRPDRVALLESVWGGRLWQRDSRAVGGGRTAGMERSAK